jgi:hypothetical protein
VSIRGHAVGVTDRGEDVRAPFGYRSEGERKSTILHKPDNDFKCSNMLKAWEAGHEPLEKDAPLQAIWAGTT